MIITIWRLTIIEIIIGLKIDIKNNFKLKKERLMAIFIRNDLKISNLKKINFPFIVLFKQYALYLIYILILIFL